MVNIKSSKNNKKKTYSHQYEVGSMYQVGYKLDDVEGSVFQIVEESSHAISILAVIVVGFMFVIFYFFTRVIVSAYRQERKNPNLAIRQFEVPDNTTALPSKLFTACRELQMVKIPSSVKAIGKDAIPKRVKIVCPLGSYAEEWGKANGNNVENY